MTLKNCESTHFSLSKDLEASLGKVGLGMWDIAAFKNGTISGSGYDFNISFTDKEGFFREGFCVISMKIRIALKEFESM